MSSVGGGSLAVWSLLLVWCLIPACSTQRQSQVTEKPANARTPLPPPAEEIKQPVNVSFSTYSKDWPVNWQWIDPEEATEPTRRSLKMGTLRIFVPNGRDLLGDRQNAPRYIKPITGDFQIETHLKFNPTENYQGAGLLIYSDASNYLRFERAYGGPGGGAGGIRIDLRTPTDERSVVTTTDLPLDLPEIDLRLVRMGREITAYWRADEEAEWRQAASYSLDLPQTVMTGVIACNTAREMVAEFGYIHLLPPPSR